MLRLGRHEDALKLVDAALALPDQMHGFAFFQQCRAETALGHYRAAIIACQTATSRDDWWFPHAYLAADYAMLDELEDAAREKTRAESDGRKLSIADIDRLAISNQPDYVTQTEQHLYRGLRKLGVADR